MPIEKSAGQTPTEQLLSRLCDSTFLKLWSYANPFKADGKELCDVIAIFDEHVFLMFDRESRKFDTSNKDTFVTWERWKREVVDKQIKTAEGAKRYLLSRQPIYLDATCRTLLPIKVSHEKVQIHKIIAAHGAEEACKNFSQDNVYGSLAISYGSRLASGPQFPFLVNLDSADPVHIFDSVNLKIILKELDTFYDFVQFIVAKEAAITRYDSLVYCGEEDLLAHYFHNFDRKKNQHYVGTRRRGVNFVAIGEGEWRDFVTSTPYIAKKAADRSSYLWDDVIQRTCDNALKGTLLGTADPFESRGAIYEMAKEPRFSRRALSDAMINAIQKFSNRCNRNCEKPLVHAVVLSEQGLCFLASSSPSNLGLRWRVPPTTTSNVAGGLRRSEDQISAS